MPKSPGPRRLQSVDLDEDVFGAPFNGPLVHEVVARRARRAPPGHAATRTARHGPRRRRQAVAPEGHRPRPRRPVALAAVDRRRHRLRPEPAPLHRQGQPQGPQGRAAQRAVGPRRARLARRARPVARSTRRRPSRPPSCSTSAAAARARGARDDERARPKSFRNLEARQRAARRGPGWPTSSAPRTLVVTRRRSTR